MLGQMAPRDIQDVAEAGDRFQAHWTIFLPALVVAIIYGGVWVFLLLAGKGESALATLCLLVLLLIVPVLLVRAFLRYATIDLRIDDLSLNYRRGWFRPHWHKISLDELSGARAILSPVGSIFGGGALELTPEVGRPIRLNDIESPEHAARKVSQRLKTIRSAGSVR